MKITSERIGETILITVETCHHHVTFVLDLAQATTLGTNLLAQACLDDDGLELPDEFRPSESA